MNSVEIKLLGKLPKLKNPIFIEGLPGVGNVGRIAAGYLVEQLKAVKYADLLSTHFYPFVLLHQSSAVHVLKNEFYYWKAKKSNQRDLIILIGDSQSIDPIGHYEIVDAVLDFIEKQGVKEIITIAGLSVNKLDKEPKVIGTVSEAEIVKQYSKYGIDFEAGSRIGTIVGAAGLFIGLGKYRGMKGLCLLGETAGLPEIPDPKSAEAVLKVLVKILNIEIDMSKLKERIKEMENFMKKITRYQDKALKELLAQEIEKTEPAKTDELRYIG
ncbi:MAG: proteasome assembly chaperone family protein [Candidatus Aenigmarchaeota archaeon]|nr:proteasome assembly chaperone family protein [Candidatus Aenigmarchaeota archaeon]MCX8179681.1 proteasome assembly chaperone family protein [Candidatus Aenigmarchaeota archaeon]